MTRTDFARHNGQARMEDGVVYSFDTYEDYVDAAIDQAMIAGRLSKDDVAFLTSLNYKF